ncbi:fucolectin-6-like [Anomaloglossus baeobatrachus]
MGRALVCAVLVLLCISGLWPESDALSASSKGNNARPGERGPIKKKNNARPLRWNPRRSRTQARTAAIFPPKIGDYAQPAPNVALKGIATQSSVNSYLGSPRNANDGSLAANYLRSQCAHTKNDFGPWWMVDLKSPHKIMSVAVTNRVLECCRERIFGAEIRVGNDRSNGGKQNPRCGVISSIESGENSVILMPRNGRPICVGDDSRCGGIFSPVRGPKSMEFLQMVPRM